MDNEANIDEAAIKQAETILLTLRKNGWQSPEDRRAERKRLAKQSVPLVMPIENGATIAELTNLLAKATAREDVLNERLWSLREEIGLHHCREARCKAFVEAAQLLGTVPGPTRKKK